MLYAPMPCCPYPLAHLDSLQTHNHQMDSLLGTLTGIGHLAATWLAFRLYRKTFGVAYLATQYGQGEWTLK